MRRDCVTQVIVMYGNGEWENFATPLEAEQYINAYRDELDVPTQVWLEDLQGRKKWDFQIYEDESGLIQLIS